jgi:16S rRNA (uracil1498-N3)-methyltransferase
VFVEDLAQPELISDDFHHLSRVLRLRDADPLTLSDARGNWCTGSFSETPTVTSELRSVVRPTPELTVAFALVKGTRPEWTVQKLAELGIDHIMLLHTSRCVVRWDEAKVQKQITRLQSVARSAAMQSRQCFVPSVGGVAALADFTPGDRVGVAALGGSTPEPQLTTLLIGPEGGWATHELDQGFAQVGLGATVLRAETAAIVAGARLVQTRFDSHAQ